jgi:hypothetical protein
MGAQHDAAREAPHAPKEGDRGAAPGRGALGAATAFLPSSASPINCAFRSHDSDGH